MLFKKKVTEKIYMSAIIACGGDSTRMNGINKQFLLLNDMPLILHTLNAFELCERVTEIILVCKEDQIGEYLKLLDGYNIQKIKSIVSGGSTRQQSIFAGIKAASANTQYYIIHDGARPLITEEIIDNCINDVLIHKATTASVKSKDTVKISSKDGFVLKTTDREHTFLTQTPQVFSKSLYDTAMLKAISGNKDYTDDAQLIESTGHKVFLSQGSYENIKVTTPEDLYIAQSILEMRG